MLDLWGKVMEDTSGPREPYWAEMPRIFTQRGNHAFDEDSDEIQRDRLKVVHTQGVVAWVKYVPEENNGYSGMLGV